FQYIQHFHGCRHRRYFASEGEAKKNVFEDLHDVRSPHHARNGEAVAHCFAKTSQVGSHTEPLLRASQSEMKAAADLVENEQRPVLMRQISHAFQKAGRWRPE